MNLHMFKSFGSRFKLRQPAEERGDAAEVGSSPCAAADRWQPWAHERSVPARHSSTAITFRFVLSATTLGVRMKRKTLLLVLVIIYKDILNMDVLWSFA